MLEITLILILVVVAMIAVIVNRRSLLACIVITVVSALLGLGFSLLYANADKFASHAKLLTFTVTASAVIIIALLAVTYIGVKMHFKKIFSSKKRYVPAPAAEATGDPMLIPGTQVYAKAVGIFGRKAIIKNENAQPAIMAADAVAPTEKIAAVAPVAAEAAPEKTVVVKTAEQVAKTATAPVPAQTQAPADAMLKRMLDKAEAFKKAGQYVLAEQMYVTYIARCKDNATRADGELLMLDCRILAGNEDGAKEQFADLMNKLRAGEYQLTQDQKKQLASCKMALVKLQQGK